MGTVSNILKSKGYTIFSIPPDITVYDALEILVDKNVGALPVIDNGKLIGIFSEKDYARKVVLKGKSSKETTIREIMTDETITVKPGNTIEECMHLMTCNFTRHLPVIENDELIGIVSIGDVVKFMIEEQQFIIENMEHYIKST